MSTIFNKPQVVVPGTSNGLVSLNGVPGNTTGNAIASGYVGEVGFQNFGGVSITTTGVSQSIATVSIPTAGVWAVYVTADVSGSATTSSQRAVSISTSNAIVFPPSTTAASAFIAGTSMNLSTSEDCITLPPLIVTASGASSAFIWARIAFSGGTANVAAIARLIRIA